MDKVNPNRIRTEPERCKSLLHKWGMKKSHLCLCGVDQAIRHVVTKFEGGVGKLQEAGTEAIKWIIDLDIPMNMLLLLSYLTISNINV